MILIRVLILILSQIKLKLNGKYEGKKIKDIVNAKIRRII